MRQSIFEKYGGFAKVSRIVMTFYDKILDSPITAPYFSNTDMRRLIDHQTKFIASVMGGPASYTNEHIERVHARLKINETAFNEALTLLIESLEDHDFDGGDIQIIEQKIMGYKNFVVTRG